MAMTAGQLISKLGTLIGGNPTVQVADSDYAIPNLDYIRKEFSPFYAEELKKMGLGNWETRWDCDDFAWQFYVQIRWAHYRTNKSMAEGIAVGVVYYEAEARAEDDSAGGHAINLAIVGDDKHPVFLEPQFAALGKDPVVELRPSEIASIWFANF